MLGVGMLFAIVLLMFVLRPVLASLSASASEIRRIHDDQERKAKERQAAEKSNDDALLLPPPDLDHKRRLTAVQTLIEEDSERVAQVVRKWIRLNG